MPLLCYNMLTCCHICCYCYLGVTHLLEAEMLDCILYCCNVPLFVSQRPIDELLKQQKKHGTICYTKDLPSHLAERAAEGAQPDRAT